METKTDQSVSHVHALKQVISPYRSRWLAERTCLHVRIWRTPCFDSSYTYILRLLLYSFLQFTQPVGFGHDLLPFPFEYLFMQTSRVSMLNACSVAEFSPFWCTFADFRRFGLVSPSSRPSCTGEVTVGQALLCVTSTSAFSDLSEFFFQCGSFFFHNVPPFFFAGTCTL